MGYIEGPVGLHRHLQDQSFTVNGFIDEEATLLYATSQGYSMIWFNPFYLEEQ
ncbi:hypothetical protein [Haemophilus influenzae]|uniref:hypothetical protein n=1 Tax=Haemophilus influenzae TaxID=727 RepID=UPI0012FEDF08|nr:hypothetical protein [Haemophilus influenzae]